MRFALATALVYAMAGYGTALAQDDDDMAGDGMEDPADPEPEGDGGGGDGAAAAESGEGGSGDAAAAMEEGKQLQVGGHFLLDGGYNSDGDFALASNDELNLWVNAKGFGPKPLSVGLDLRMAIIKPDTGATLGEIKFLQMFKVHGGWKLDNGVTPYASLGTAPAGMFFRSMWGAPVFPLSFLDSKFGGTVGAGYDRKMNDIMIHASGELVFQADSDVDDMGQEKMGLGLGLGLMALYAVQPGKISAGVALDVRSGPGFEFDADEGMHVPFEILGMYHLNKATWVGAHFGFASLVQPGGVMDAGGNEWGLGNALNFGIAAQHTLSL